MTQAQAIEPRVPKQTYNPRWDLDGWTWMDLWLGTRSLAMPVSVGYLHHLGLHHSPGWHLALPQPHSKSRQWLRGKLATLSDSPRPASFRVVKTRHLEHSATQPDRPMVSTHCHSDGRSRTYRGFSGLLGSKPRSEDCWHRKCGGK